MRQRTAFISVSAIPFVLMFLASPAFADNGPHVAGAGIVADSCAGCHRAHTAQGSKLLTEATQTALCYTCHGASGTGANSDVESGVGYSGEGRSGGVAGALRGGGFEYALIDSANPSGQNTGGWNTFGTIPVKETGEAVTSTHSINGSDQMAWGNGMISPTPNYGKTIQLRCGSCHDPHGNGNYRILRPIPLDSGGPGGDPGPVNIPDTGDHVYTTDNYWPTEDSEDLEYSLQVGDWCSTCHSRYWENTSDFDSGDAVYRYRHRSVHPGAGLANCAQCHIAHGSNASMSGEYSGNVGWPDGTPAGTDSRLLRIDNRGICQMCHNR